MTCQIVYAPRALRQLGDIEDYIAENASPQTAERFVSGIMSFCESLDIFPQRGALREELGDNVRIVGYRRRVAVVTKIDGAKVVIVGIFYGGQDIEAALDADD